MRTGRGSASIGRNQTNRQCKLVVMRHGQTPANAEGRYQGALDIGLSDTGVAQIRVQARALVLAQVPFQRLLSSPLLRARQSAALVAHGVVVKVIRVLTVARFDDFFEWQLANGAVLEVSLAGRWVSLPGRAVNMASRP